MATIGVISDSHQHLRAIQATLEGPLAGLQRRVCLGDFCGRGPDDPAECLELLLSHGVELLVGNYELAAVGGPPAGSMKKRLRRLAPRLRHLILDDVLRMATVADGRLLVHGGVSSRFWKRAGLRDLYGDDVEAIADELNARLRSAVASGDFADPVFNDDASPLAGPVWARIGKQLAPRRRLPPFAQVVGHTPVAAVASLSDPAGGPGRILATNVDGGFPRDGVVGYAVLGG